MATTDFCLTFDTQPSVRKTHNSGRKHKESVKLYYMNWLEHEAQNMIDQGTACEPVYMYVHGCVK